MLAYWGSTGALPKLTLDLARAAARDGLNYRLSISAENELLEQILRANSALLVVPTFKKKLGAVGAVSSLYRLQDRLVRQLSTDGTEAFVSLLSHVWGPLVAPLIRRAGVRHVVVVHDADPHPGDLTGLVNRWLFREAEMADHVVTLSAHVAEKLADHRRISENKISVLFHPDLDYAETQAQAADVHRLSLKVLFFGRLLKYKGLDLLVEAAEQLSNEGVDLELGVFGRGNIGDDLMQRLKALKAHVAIGWLPHSEIAGVFSQYDLLVAPYTEASQSGVVSAAFGAGLPVIATPVGGIVDQVIHNVNGILTESVTAAAIARALRKVAQDRYLLIKLRDGIRDGQENRSLKRFIRELSGIALGRS